MKKNYASIIKYISETQKKDNITDYEYEATKY